MRILITCFQPFKGRENNGSQVLARYLKAHYLQEYAPTDELRILDIPVRWGAVETSTTTTIDSWKPDILIGLGEGRQGVIALETTGRNVRDGEDIDGNPPPDACIDPLGETERKANLGFKWSPDIELPAPLHISLDAGHYLCNNALYVYCGTGCHRVGFIHIPPQADVDDLTYSALYGPVLLRILLQNRVSSKLKTITQR